MFVQYYVNSLCLLNYRVLPVANSPLLLFFLRLLLSHLLAFIANTCLSVCFFRSSFNKNTFTLFSSLFFLFIILIQTEYLLHYCSIWRTRVFLISFWSSSSRGKTILLLFFCNVVIRDRD